MMRLLIKYGELTLKGKNRKNFIDALYQRIKNKIENDVTKIDKRHDRMFVTLDEDKYEVVRSKLLQIVGLHSFTIIYECEKDLDKIKDLALSQALLHNEPLTMKVETKRSDKRFPMSSPQISREVAGHVLRNTENFTVDVKNPDYTILVEIGVDSAYVHGKAVKGLGGLPYGSSGKGLCLLSGGIDSPVSAFQMMKRGMEVDFLHFESSPLTPIESVQKVVDLAKKVSAYGPKRGVRLYLVPFKDLHMEILNNVDDSYKITIMRRMMFRIAERWAEKIGAKALITGESLGQVASQTVESMETINDVVNIPVLRPLVAHDKEAIVAISKEIDTYETSIRPFEDCCTVYVPKKPVTKPTIKRALREERFEFDHLIDQCIENMNMIKITEDSEIDLPSLGLEMIF